jgi:DNA-binding NarL/FixJ family response regulator
MNDPGGSNRPIRLLLVDHRPSVQRGLKMRFAMEEDLEVVGEAAEATEAIPLARTLRPDVILMDVEMSGIASAGRLRAAAPQSAVVIFTLHDDAATREQARAAGAAAFVAKHRTEEVLLEAIRGVAATYRKQGRHDRVAAGTEESTDDTRERRDT